MSRQAPTWHLPDRFSQQSIDIKRGGYRAVLSWLKLSNTVVDDQALVIFECDGKPLEAREGSLALYSGADKHGGPRNVRWLKSIKVRSLD